VGEQEPHGPGRGAGTTAAARRQGERAEGGAVQRDRERPEQAPPAGLASQGVSAAAGCGR
jgi:hypothetical protein